MKSRAIVIVLIAVVAVLVLLFGVKRQETRPSKAIVGLGVPDLRLSDPSGKPVDLSFFKDSVVFVNFWATWCPPCREEMPSIQSLYNQYRDHKGFRMVTVLYREDYQRAMAYMKENNYDFPVVMDPGERTAKSYGVTGVPETYIVDKGGILREKMVGPFDWGSPQVSAFLSGLMKQ